MKKLICCFKAILIISVFFITCSNESPSEPKNPQLNVNPTSCDFTKNVNIDTLIISNSGGGELSWEIAEKPGWIEVSKSRGKVTTGSDTVIITADINQAVGTYSATININSNGGNLVLNISLDISPWIRKKCMSTSRVWFSCGVVAGKIYVIGGATKDGTPALTTVEEYDPVADIWTRKQNMPTRRRSMASAVVDGKIYIIGGGLNFQIGVAEGVRTLEVYDPANDTWTPKTDALTAREGASASVVNGIIYVVGGVKPGGDASNDVEAYDPTTDTWTAKTPMISARWALSTAVVDGKIYAMGGSGQASRKVEEYDPATDTWTGKSVMPLENGYFGTCAIDGIIYTMGGGSGAGILYSRVFAYDPSADKWSEKTAMPTARFGLGAAVVNEKIYAIGGAVDWPPTALSTVEEYDPGLEP